MWASIVASDHEFLRIRSGIRGRVSGAEDEESFGSSGVSGGWSSESMDGKWT